MIKLLDRTVLGEWNMQEEPLDVFHSYAGGHVACRRVYRGDWQNSVIMLDGTIIGQGEDPRIMMHGKWPVITAVDTTVEPWVTRWWHAGMWRDFAFSGGKNWVPFPNGKVIGIVHAYDPPMVLLGRDSYQPKNTGYTEQGPDGFSAYRGGTNGVALGRSHIVGLGHITRRHSRLTHRPFLWTLDRNFSEMIRTEISAPSPFSLCDPTSLERHENGRDFVLHTCETEHEWARREGVMQSVRYRMVL